jgi:hypothetical protein
MMDFALRDFAVRNAKKLIIEELIQQEGAFSVESEYDINTMETVLHIQILLLQKR